MRKPGILVISHGSRESTWTQLVDDAVQQLPLRGELPVAASFLELVEGRLIQDGIDLLEGQGVTDILVIPLFVSSGSTHVNEIAYALGVIHAPAIETDLTPFRIQANIIYGDPIDNDPDVARMVWDKVKSESQNPKQEVLILVGHGSSHSGFRERWEEGLSRLAKSIQRIGGLAEADYALLRPGTVRAKVEYWQKERGMQVIAAPLFLSDGYFTRSVIPQRLEGLKYRYSGQALLPHPLLTQWMDRQIRGWLEGLS